MVNSLSLFWVWKKVVWIHPYFWLFFFPFLCSCRDYPSPKLGSKTKVMQKDRFRSKIGLKKHTTSGNLSNKQSKAFYQGKGIKVIIKVKVRLVVKRICASVYLYPVCFSCFPRPSPRTSLRSLSLSLLRPPHAPPPQATAAQRRKCGERKCFLFRVNFWCFAPNWKEDKSFPKDVIPPNLFGILTIFWVFWLYSWTVPLWFAVRTHSVSKSELALGRNVSRSGAFAPKWRFSISLGALIFWFGAKRQTPKRWRFWVFEIFM